MFVVILKVMLIILFTYQRCQSFNTGDQYGMSVGNLVSGRLMQCVSSVSISPLDVFVILLDALTQQR